MPAATELSQKHCVPCESKTDRLPPKQVKSLLREVSKWKLVGSGRHLHRDWKVKDFLTALDFFRRIGKIAEAEDHHPDLHVVGYRNVAIELWTHAVDGLTENDFILAAKINELPVDLKN